MTAKVFISSTGNDLAAYRQVAREVCEELGLAVIGMETFEAMGAGATEASKRKLDEADVYVGIVAHRYGYIEKGHDKSVTELEFDHAGTRGLERLCFLHDPAHAWPPAYFDAEGHEALEAFKSRLEAGPVRALFTTEETFRHELYRALESWKKRHPLDGAAFTNFLHQLPPPPADFTGREDHLAAMLRAIDGDGAHGVTICGLRGMGGVGKTGLALVLADRLQQRYPDAQLVVDLRGTDPEPLAPAAAMAQVVQSFRPSVRPPDDPAMLAAAYRSELHGKRALLLLDNASGAAQVQPLLPPATCLCVVTSRTRFALPGQRAVDLDALSAEEARELLRRLAIRIDDVTADHIATLCGRLPLALRLAGGSLSQRPDLTPEEYARRLEEAPARLRLSDGTVSVEGSIGLSWNLLADADRKLLARLSVFSRGIDREAAIVVWDKGREAADAALGRLLSASVLEWDAAAERYRLHDLVLDFATSRLAADEAAKGSRLHARHYAHVLKRANALYLAGRDSAVQGLALFDRERGNVEAGFTWARSQIAADETLARLCSEYLGGGAFILDLRLHPLEQISWLEAGLAAARSVGDHGAAGRHLGNLGNAHLDLGQPRRAIECYEQVLAIAKSIGDHQGESYALGSLGNAWAELGEPRRAIEYYECDLAIAREIADRRGEESTLGNLGGAYVAIGEPRRAIGYMERELEIAHELGDRRGEGSALGNLGVAYAALGEPNRAIEYYQRSLKIARELGDRRREGGSLGNLGRAYAALGERRKAIEYNEKYLTVARMIGDRRGEAKASWNLGLVYSVTGDLARAAELMSASVKFEREIGHADAASHAEQLAEIQRQLLARRQ